MIRTKVTLIFFVIVVLLGGAAVTLVSADFTAAQHTSLEAALRRSANIAEQSIRLDEASLLERAKLVAQAEELHRAMTGKAEQPAAADPEGQAAEAEAPADNLSFVERRHLAVHEKLDAQRYKLDDVFKRAGSKRNLELSAIERRPHDHDIFVALDVKGEGVAALGKDLYSWFGQDVAAKHPGVREVAKSGEARVEYWNWSFGQSKDERPYRVAIAPIRRSENDSTAGVVVLGTMLNDGLAKGKQRLVAGVAEDDKTADLDGAPQFAILRGKSVVASTFDTTMQTAIPAQLEGHKDSNAVSELTIADRTYFAISRHFAGEGETAMTVVVFGDLVEGMSAAGQTTTSLVLLFVVMALLGAGLIFFVAARWVAPLEDIESGIQEVLAGNKDFTWTPINGHALQTSLAQGLNLMSAFLQGRAMPDEDGTGGGWGAGLDENSMANPEAPKIQGVALPLMQAAPPKKTEE